MQLWKLAALLLRKSASRPILWEWVYEDLHVEAVSQHQPEETVADKIQISLDLEIWNQMKHKFKSFVIFSVFINRERF